MSNNYSQYIDHTLLAATANQSEISKICQEAIQYNFKSVCVNPSHVPLAKNILKGTGVKVCTVIGFPLGQNTTEVKYYETLDALRNGADEIDMVVNIEKLKMNDQNYNLNEINKIKDACGKNILKVIVETTYLNEQDKVNAANLILNSRADFIKTSSGFAGGGATVEDVRLFKSILTNKKLIKASGGVKTSDDLKAMVDAGADRIGTSRGVDLMNGITSNTNQY